MFQKLVPVNKEVHLQKKIKQVDGFGFAGQFHVASVMLHEFVRCAAIYPIVFLEDAQKDEFRPVVLLGLDAGENLFVDAGGKWQASYVPAIIRRYPFALARGEADGQFTVCIDEGSPLVSESEGNPLFNEGGTPAPALENVKRYLGELQQMETVTREFCRFWAEHNMFTPLNMRVKHSDQVRNIGGCYILNEERLNKLSDELFLDIRRKHYLPAVYAHLVGLSQVERLVTLKEQRSEKLAAELAVAKDGGSKVH